MFTRASLLAYAGLRVKYGGPKSCTMCQYLSDNVYAPIDNIYVMVDDNYAMIDDNYATMMM